MPKENKFPNIPSPFSMESWRNKEGSHDYDELVTIYTHLDSTTTIALLSESIFKGDLNTPAEWGKLIKNSADGRMSIYMRDFGKGHKIFTHVFWAK